MATKCFVYFMLALAAGKRATIEDVEMQHEFIVSRGTTTSGQQKQFPTKRLETQSQIVYNVLHTADMLSHRFMA